MTDTATPIEAQHTETTPVEVVRDETRNVPAVVEHEGGVQSSALERATDAALAMPGAAGRDEFIALAMQARVLSLSGAAPKMVRNNPYVALHVAMVGRDLGISPSAALNLIDVIGEGDKVQLSLSPELINGQIRRLGLGRIVPIERSLERCVAQAVAADGTVLGETEFTWEDAQIAGIAGKECTPTQHKNRTGKDYCPCRQGWRTYPKRMLWWRAAGFCASDFFPEASLGLYTPEELGATVDDEGRPIDPTTVALPQGFEPERAPEPEPASDEDRAELRRRISALPEAGQEALKALVLETRDREGVEPLGSLDKFYARQLGRWKAVVARVESRAKAGEWGDWKPPADGSTGEMPPAPAEPPQEPETGPEATGTAGTEQERSDSHTDAPDGESDQPSLLGNAADGEDEQTKVAIALVQAMSAGKVNEALRTRWEPVDGNVDTRRRRLVVAMIRETVAQRETN